MANSTSTIIQPTPQNAFPNQQKGLVSTVPTGNVGLTSSNPFLNTNGLRTDGTTTSMTGGVTGQNVAGIPYGNGQTTPTTSAINFNGLITPPQIGNSGGSTGNSGTDQNDPYSTANYYAAHPDADPNNSSNNAANTYNGGVNGNGQTFPGYVSALSGTAAGPTQTYNQNQQNSTNAQNGLIGTAPSNNADVVAQQQKIQDLTNQYNGMSTAISGGATNLAEAGGEQGLLQNLYASNLGAEQQGLANILSGNAQQQTAYNEAGGLANTAASNATSQQGTQQSGQAAAARLAQPQQVSPTNVPYNPTSNTYGSPAATAYGSNGTDGLQSVGNISGQIGIGQNVAQLNSSLGGAQVVGQNLNKLISDNNINPTALTFANGALQLGAQYTSNAAYQQFQGQINDFIASLAPILGAGGNVTDMKTQMSSQIVNALQSGQSIQDTVNYFLDQAKQKIGGLSAGGGAGQSNGTNNTTNSQYNW